MTDTPITTAREMCEAAARAVGDLRGRDVPRRDAEDAGEGYDLAIDEAQAAIRALASRIPEPTPCHCILTVGVPDRMCDGVGCKRIPEPGEDDVERVARAIDARRQGFMADADFGRQLRDWEEAKKDARAALSAMRPAEGWRPIETAPKDKQITCGHLEKRWVRFGHYYSNVGRWYYSGTSERSQWAQVEGDAPTHWMPLPAAPAQGGEE